MSKATLCRFVAVAVMLCASLNAAAQAAQRKKAPAAKGDSISARVAEAKADVKKAAAEYKTSLEKLLVLQQADLDSATKTLEVRKSLSGSIVSKREVEDSERAVLQAQGKVNDTRREIAETDNLVAEADASEQMSRMPVLRAGGSYTTAALIRFAGTGGWKLADAAKVESYFASTFKHELPISAFGQSAAHDKLGFDHHNAIDVAVHPDTPEGQALMAYLRSAGIPFIAFRHAVPGSATGAHIHIGYPSKRIAH